MEPSPFLRLQEGVEARKPFRDCIFLLQTALIGNFFIGGMMYWNRNLCRNWTAAAFFAFLIFGFGTAVSAQQVDSAAAMSSAAAIPAEPQQAAQAQTSPAAADTQAGHITGTVEDTYGDIVAGATVVLDDGTITDQRSVDSDDNGFFQFSGVKPGVTYHVTIHGKGFADWKSQEIVVKSGEFATVAGIQLKLSEASTSVTVYADNLQIATEQIQVAEKQRVLGFIPNFYVVYDSQNVVPMPAKLKFKLAFKVAVDPVSFAAAAFLGTVDQASDSPDYPQGWGGFGERVGARYADGFTDIMFGGAILPALLHQDPRYYYQGTGTTSSRLKHALAYPFICKGDNGKLQPNYSTIGGDLISAGLSNLYYPPSNRGVGLVFTNLAIGTAERGLSTVLQEFVLRRLTPASRKTN